MPDLQSNPWRSKNGGKRNSKSLEHNREKVPNLTKRWQQFEKLHADS